MPCSLRAQTDWQRKVAERLRPSRITMMSPAQLARHASRVRRRRRRQAPLRRLLGGGPSVMEAANRGAQDEGCDSIGLNIVLPHEQLPNTYVTPDLSFQFHYFALAEDALPAARAGGRRVPRRFGTFDEFFRAADPDPDRQVRPLPILSVRQGILDPCHRFPGAGRGGVISPGDLDLFHWCEDADEAWKFVVDYYEND
jgi:predicted Rossmann-fold nucleotide-binding protein